VITVQNVVINEGLINNGRYVGWATNAFDKLLSVSRINPGSPTGSPSSRPLGPSLKISQFKNYMTKLSKGTKSS
jgi:hypothetical protein